MSGRLSAVASEDAIAITAVAVLTPVVLSVLGRCGASPLFAGTVLAGALLIDTSVLEQTLQRPVNFTDYLTLAWITSSLATVGGAIGSGLENEETVRAELTATIPNPAAGGTSGIGRLHRADPSAATADG